MHTFPKRYKLPKQSQEEINNMHSSVMVNEIKSVDKYILSFLPKRILQIPTASLMKPNIYDRNYMNAPQSLLEN